ncbi:MAG: hypothetical protein AAF581_08535 [Planctomycetota bacterium]
MPRRASNRERLQRMALEAELTAAEKADKPAAPKKRATKKSESAPSRPGLKLVWKVFDARSKVVAAFPFPLKEKAERKAADLCEETGQAYTVRGVKVPLDEVV